MYGYIDGYDFGEMEAMKYYAPPSTWSDEKKRDSAREKIYSGLWYGAEKKDGYFAKLVKDEDGTIILYSRSRGVNGKFADKHEWVPQLNWFFDAIPCGTCLLGELHFPSKPGSRQVTTIMGCLKDKAIDRQENGERLEFYAFDCLAWRGVSMLTAPAQERFNKIESLATIYNFGRYVSFASYKTGRDLWLLLQELLANGAEGVVITYGDGKYEPGKRPSKTTLKIKKELKQTIDCFFTGRGSAPTREYTGKEIETWTYWEDMITREKIQGELYKDYVCGRPIEPVTKGYFNGWCGSLEIAVLRDRMGSLCKIGDKILTNKEVCSLGWLSGLSDEMKANPTLYAFHPLEITAMEYDSFNHTLRHGKAVGWRKDLTIEDCTLEKIEG